MNLSAAILEIARAVTEVAESTSTGAGSVTTLVDTTQAKPDTYWVGGTLFILSGGHAGKTAKVTGYVKSSGTFTFTPSLTPAPGAGVSYAVTSAEYDRGELVQALGQALDKLGAVPQENRTLVVVAGQEEYTLPAGVLNVRQVLEETADADPYKPEHNYWWKEQFGRLIFDPGKTPSREGLALRLLHKAPAAEVYADSDTISDYIPLERLKWAGAVFALRARYIDVGKDSPGVTDRFKEAQQQEAVASTEHPIPDIPRDPHYGAW